MRELEEKKEVALTEQSRILEETIGMQADQDQLIAQLGSFREERDSLQQQLTQIKVG